MDPSKKLTRIGVVELLAKESKVADRPQSREEGGQDRSAIRGKDVGGPTFGMKKKQLLEYPRPD